MTRADYMQHLREALVGYDSQFVQEILDNYEEHFEAGIRSGRTEEEICEELGNIESFLKDIEDMMGDKDIHTHEIEKVTAIQQEDKRDDNGEIGCIELSMLSIDVSVLPSRDGQLHSYFESGKDKGEYLEEDFSGGCYFAKERPRKKNGKDKSFLGIAFMVGFGNNTDDLGRLIVEVPAQVHTVKVKSLQGDITAENLKAEKTTLESMSGDIRLTQWTSPVMQVKTFSGDVKTHEVYAQESTMQTTSGDVEIRCGKVKELSINSTSGDIKILDMQMERLKAKSVSGDIEVNESEAEELSVSSTSGDVKGRLYGKKLSVQTVSGDIRMTLDRRGKRLMARSQTMSGEVRIVDNYQPGGQTDADAISGYFSTISGDISVR